jgi:UPF0755 protein
MQSVLFRVGIILLLGILLGYMAVLHLPGPGNTEEIVFSIPAGVSSRIVAEELEKGDFIHSRWVFLVNVLLSGKSDRIIAGDYRLHRAMSMREIASLITSGGVVSQERTVTFKEGWTVSDIGRYLEEEGTISRNPFTEAARNSRVLREQFSFLNDFAAGESLEGYLFPDTYRIRKDASADAVVELLLSTFERKVAETFEPEAERQGKSFRDVIILASIVEKEVGRNFSAGTPVPAALEKQVQEERELVAGIFWKRLSLGVPLQADSTVNYATGKNVRQASADDIQITSPYNTYRVKGLPPTPISNPGLASIRAALFPKESEYLYFLSKPDGEAVFSRTFEEHNRNKQKYLK